MNSRIRQITPQGIITTIAGTGQVGFSGDGGLATNAKFDHPAWCAIDNANNIYIADLWNHRIRKITRSNGIINTIAGNGEFGSIGDGGPSATARLGFPSGLTFDNNGNIFFSDLTPSFGSTIRKIDTFGIVTRYCGDTSVMGHSGDGGPAHFATLNYCGGLAFDSSGNLFLAEFYGHTIRRITPPPASVAGSPKPSLVRLLVYPNPVNKVLHIQVQNGKKNAEVRLINMFGQQVTRQPLYSSKASIDMSGYPPGMYNIVLNCDGNIVQAAPVVKQ